MNKTLSEIANGIVDDYANGNLLAIKKQLKNLTPLNAVAVVCAAQEKMRGDSQRGNWLSFNVFIRAQFEE